MALVILAQGGAGFERQKGAQAGVTVNCKFMQRMNTKWGAFNLCAWDIRLNTELVKKPRDLLGYIVVHQMVHLLETIHSGQRHSYALSLGFRKERNLTLGYPARQVLQHADWGDRIQPESVTRLGRNE